MNDGQYPAHQDAPSCMPGMNSCGLGSDAVVCYHDIQWLFAAKEGTSVNKQNLSAWGATFPCFYIGFGFWGLAVYGQVVPNSNLLNPGHSPLLVFGVMGLVFMAMGAGFVWLFSKPALSKRPVSTRQIVVGNPREPMQGEPGSQQISMRITSTNPGVLPQDIQRTLQSQLNGIQWNPQESAQDIQRDVLTSLQNIPGLENASVQVAPQSQMPPVQGFQQNPIVIGVQTPNAPWPMQWAGRAGKWVAAIYVSFAICAVGLMLWATFAWLSSSRNGWLALAVVYGWGFAAWLVWIFRWAAQQVSGITLTMEADGFSYTNSDATPTYISYSDASLYWRPPGYKDHGGLMIVPRTALTSDGAPLTVMDSFNQWYIDSLQFSTKQWQQIKDNLGSAVRSAGGTVSW
ncbi:MAG: hypothetical protein FWF36_01920 [Propionibacteriaceae bacterium]|nr:hypothetical protein [Propionibacteriaceae bacterium]